MFHMIWNKEILSPHCFLIWKTLFFFLPISSCFKEKGIVFWWKNNQNWATHEISFFVTRNDKKKSLMVGGFCVGPGRWWPLDQGCLTRASHGLPKVSLGPAKPNPSMPCRRPPQAMATHSAGGLRPCYYPFRDPVPCVSGDLSLQAMVTVRQTMLRNNITN
jgi:hypothetical protein